ncbi:patatin-like phospholipase family protein [Haliea sp. E17]|uniref:patatin-like phospholipase family protein n=1 Tax=Haliea sp. E17 TaxID=3401576 RepID=UPI003AAB33CF
MSEHVDYTRAAEDVIAAEQRHIARDPHCNTDKPVGLAFSGGGIRSASFALGVLQALVARDKLKHIDYLSTVSGGGYIGSALTWFLDQKIPPWMQGPENAADEYFGTSPENFPLGRKSSGNRVASADYRPNAILDFIRQHGNYLVPGQGITALSMIGYTLRALLISLTAYLLLLTTFMVAFQQYGFYSNFPGGIEQWPGVEYGLGNGFFILSLATFFLFLLFGYIYSLFTRFNGGTANWHYRMRTLVQRWNGYLMIIGFASAILGSIQVVHLTIMEFTSAEFRMPAASTSVLAGLIGAVSQFRRLVQSGTRASKFMVVLTGALMLYGLGLMAYWLAETIILAHSPTWWLTLIMVCVAVLVSMCVNINYLGLHRMYRDRLMETFMPNLASVQADSWGMATEADTANIDTLCRHNRRPYHIVNTNITLVDSKISKYRGRGGDNFILSPLYCGSDATGWRCSENYLKQGYRSGMALATAMAISGAAVNPNDAVAGKGINRDRIVATVLSVLNLRLGFWATHPDPDKHFLFPPNFIYPALTGGVLSGGMSETRRAIELTDGGHFENLALYELIRRKLKVIICTDGGADPDFRFSDLANLVERARVDFGAHIEFDEHEYCLENLLPGSESDDYFVSKYKGAKNAFALATITYHDGSEGMLIYLKTTLVKGLTADLIGYKTANPSFPDQATADQFFDEPQFEAYRELGYQLGQRMLAVNNETGWF